MKRIYIFLMFYGFIFNTASSQHLEFVRENIVCRLDPSHMNVTGELWFSNPGSQTVSQSVYLPFACEGSDYVTDSLAVMDCSTNTPLKTFRRNIAGTMLQVSVEGKTQKKVKFNYIQNHDGKRSGFIVTKVKYWNKPLPEAQYTLIIENPSIKIDSTSYKPDNVSTQDGKTKMTWRKYNFKPEKELCFYFHVE